MAPTPLLAGVYGMCFICNAAAGSYSHRPVKKQRHAQNKASTPYTEANPKWAASAAGNRAPMAPPQRHTASLADAHRHAALAFRRTRSSPAAAGAVDDAAEQATSSKPAASNGRPGNMAWAGAKQTPTHSSQRHGGGYQDRQQHRAVAPAVGQQAPGQSLKR